jgi:hypothetical protein
MEEVTEIEAQRLAELGVRVDWTTLGGSRLLHPRVERWVIDLFDGWTPHDLFDSHRAWKNYAGSTNDLRYAIQTMLIFPPEVRADLVRGVLGALALGGREGAMALLRAEEAKAVRLG